MSRAQFGRQFKLLVKINLGRQQGGNKNKKINLGRQQGGNKNKKINLGRQQGVGTGTGVR